MLEYLDKPRYFIVFLLIIGIGYGGYAMYTHSQSQNPDWQTRIKRTDNFPPYRLNVWSYPYPPNTGQISFALEYDFIEIMNKKVGDVSVLLKSSGNTEGTQLETEAKYREEGRYKGRYRANFKIPEPGDWILIVRTSWQGRQSENRIEITVDR